MIDEGRRLQHTFLGHFQAVTTLSQFEAQPHLLLSGSLDSTCRIWSLDSFQHQYTLEMPSNLNFIRIQPGAEYITLGMQDCL